MKNFLLSSVLLIALTGCGGGSSDSSESSSATINNNLTDWNVLNSDGYSGEGVIFANNIATGEWNVYHSGVASNNFAETNLNLIIIYIVIYYNTKSILTYSITICRDVS